MYSSNLPLCWRDIRIFLLLLLFIFSYFAASRYLVGIAAIQLCKVNCQTGAIISDFLGLACSVVGEAVGEAVYYYYLQWR